MKNLRLILLMTVTCSMFNSAAAQENIYKPKIKALNFHADRYGSCKVMGPVLEDLTNKLDGEPMLFYKWDFTNNTTKHLSLMMGLSYVLQEKTGIRGEGIPSDALFGSDLGFDSPNSTERRIDLVKDFNMAILNERVVQINTEIQTIQVLKSKLKV